MYLRHVESGAGLRVPNQPTGSTLSVWTSYFEPEVRIPLSTVIDPLRDVIQITASLADVQFANFVEGYGGATMPLSSPLQVATEARSATYVAQTFLTAGVGLSVITFKLCTSTGRDVRSSGSYALNESQKYSYASSTANARKWRYHSNSNGLDTPIVEVDWTLNVWRYQ